MGTKPVYAIQFFISHHRTLIMKHYNRKTLRLIFSCWLIVFLFSPPLVLSAITECHCSEHVTLPETEKAESHEKDGCCSDDCSCCFSASSNEVHSNFVYPGLVSQIYKLFSSTNLVLPVIPDELLVLHHTIIPQLGDSPPLANHIPTTILRI